MGKLEIGSWQQNCPGQDVCGDRYFIQEDENTLTVAIIDGLGHGPKAAQAADKAVAAMENTNMSLSEVIPEAHRQLLGTRGAVLSIARIDYCSGNIKYIGIGNIYTYIVDQNSVHRLISAEGFLGYRLPRFHEYSLEWGKTKQIIMFSDGISAIPGRELLKMGWRNAADIARIIGEKWGVNNDDKTVLVVKEKED